jgi:putative tricarboxylic transport membrane protein
MSHKNDESVPADAPARDYAQFGLAAGLALLAIVILANTWDLKPLFAEDDPVGPRVFPQIIAAGLLLTALWVAIATWRGDVPEGEAGEDVDLTAPTDWKSVGMLVAAFVFLIVTVNPLGWTVSSAIFFTAVTYVLGSRTWARNLLIGAILGVASFYLFYSGLGVALPAGILDGIL